MFSKSFGLLILILVSSLLFAQGPPVPIGDMIPIIDRHYECTSPTGPAFTMNYKKYPKEIQTEVVQPIVSADVSVPVISAVSSPLGNVLANTVKFTAAATGIAFTVNASDNTGIVAASLYVNKTIATTSNRTPALPRIFYMRWNADGLTPGTYQFALLVWDAAGNVTQKSWSMDLI